MELYIHIPFCARKCAYCDFLSFPGADHARMTRYMQALCCEIRAIPEEEKEPVTSIFIGGGTPSVLKPDLLSLLLSELNRHFFLTPDAEISMEANPGTLSMEKLKACRRSGVNRLSLGLQSADNSLLWRLGRIHTWTQFLESVELSREAGFQNINADLMFALPGQSLSDWEDTLCRTAELGLTHISAYSLILEPGTPLADDPAVLSELPDEETEYAMVDVTAEVLRGYGYHQYEISNYAESGRECRHNLGYWTHVPYLGLGLGASSFLHHTRFSNTTDIEEYLAEAGRPTAIRRDVTPLSLEDEMSERMILGLRLTKGVDLKKFRQDFGCSAEEAFRTPIQKYVSSGHLILEDERLYLTRQAIHVSNTIMADFLL